MTHDKIGTLILVESSGSSKIGDLCYLPGCIDSLGILKEQRERGDADVFTVKNGTQITYKHYVLEPVVISRIEKIVAGDLVLCDDRNGVQDQPEYSIQTVDHIENGWIFTKETNGQGYNPDWTSKIISTPDFFSPETLRKIVDGKLKEKGIVVVNEYTKTVIKATNDVLWNLIKEKLYVGDSEDDKNIDWVISMLREEYLPPKPKKQK